MASNENFCDKSLKPWFTTLIALSIFLILWVVVKREELFFTNEIEPQAVVAPVVSPGEPAFPAPMQPANFTQPYSPNHYGLAAITKATPNGGVQLVANRTPLAGFQNSLKDAVNRVMPAVCDVHAVFINRSGIARRPRNPQQPMFLSPFDGVIDKFVQNRGFENIGAGVIIDQRGYILTNHHVVQDATNILITVTGNPPRDYNATTIAHDAKNDLALLKIKSNTTFPEAILGNSKFVEIGDYVIAIGSPFGMEQTVTSGIISGIRKSTMIDGVRYNNLFQTDAPINRGSSGGPLVDLNGEVIGITTAIYAPTGVFNGTGFAIPINNAKSFIEKALKRPFPLALNKRGMFAQQGNQQVNQQINQRANGGTVNFNAPLPMKFGVEAINLDPVMAKHLGVTMGYGVLVNKVFDNTPASLAGLQRGDAIISLAGIPVRTTKDIPGIISHLKSGDNIHLRVVRNGMTDEFLVKLW